MAVAALSLFGTGGCTVQDSENENATAVVTNTVEPEAIDLANLTLPIPRPPIDRAALIAAAAESASAYARGLKTEDVGQLTGQPFTLRLPFGCMSPGMAAREPGLAAARSGSKEGDVRLELAPADWTDVAWLHDSEAPERIDGYWIERPWLLTSDCPVIGNEPATGSVTSPQTLGLAQFHGKDSSRLGRRDGRPYSFVVRPQPGPAPATSAPQSPRPYSVVLSGRISTFADGRAIRCRATGSAQRPVCIVAVQIDRVAFENANGEVVSEWRTG